jgi:plastocyanin
LRAAPDPTDKSNQHKSDNTMRLSKQLLTRALPCVVLLLAGATHAAQEHVIPQKNKAFSVKKLSIKVGDTVKFVNEDSFAHNVFSLSPVKSFDLGSYGNGGAKSVVFDKPGKVEVECAVHPDMLLAIEVTP